MAQQPGSRAVMQQAKSQVWLHLLTQPLHDRFRETAEYSRGLQITKGQASRPHQPSSAWAFFMATVEEKFKELWESREKAYKESWDARDAQVKELDVQFQVQWDARVKVWPMLNIMQCEVECAGEGGEGEVGCMVGCCVWCLCAVEPRPRSQAPPVIDWEASGPWTDMGFQHGAGTGVPVSWSPGARAMCQSALSGAIASLNLDV